MVCLNTAILQQVHEWLWLDWTLQLPPDQKPPIELTIWAGHNVYKNTNHSLKIKYRVCKLQTYVDGFKSPFIFIG